MNPTAPEMSEVNLVPIECGVIEGGEVSLKGRRWTNCNFIDCRIVIPRSGYVVRDSVFDECVFVFSDDPEALLAELRTYNQQFIRGLTDLKLDARVYREDLENCELKVAGNHPRVAGLATAQHIEGWKAEVPRLRRLIAEVDRLIGVNKQTAEAFAAMATAPVAERWEWAKQHPFQHVPREMRDWRVV